MNSNLLRASIVEHGMTQGKLAKAIGISENSMSRKLNGKREFTISEASAICEILRLSNPQDIFLLKKSQMCNGKIN